MENIKLVICDIDNTIVVKHRTLTQRTKDVIKKLQKNGIYFGIASGRSIEEIKRIVNNWGFSNFDILIGLNGSVLWDGVNNKQHDYYKLKKEWIKEIIEFMSKFENNPVIYRNDKLLCGKLDELVKLSSKSAGMESVVLNNISDFYSEENAKIMFRVNENDMNDLEKYIEDNPSDKYQGFKTQTTLMEFANKKVSKAFALKKFCEINKLSIKDVIAFGDTTNDNEMLKVSGIGVCMLNGSDDTKAIADFISDKECDDDGWADFMENHVLKKLDLYE